jgi:hypothetical protein
MHEEGAQAAVEERDEQHLRRDSDALLDEIDELKAMESTKRQHEISSPEFHDLADRVTDKSRHIFAIAADERVTGNRIDNNPEGKTTEDVDP